MQDWIPAAAPALPPSSPEVGPRRRAASDPARRTRRRRRATRIDAMPPCLKKTCFGSGTCDYFYLVHKLTCDELSYAKCDCSGCAFCADGTDLPEVGAAPPAPAAAPKAGDESVLVAEETPPGPPANASGSNPSEAAALSAPPPPPLPPNMPPLPPLPSSPPPPPPLLGEGEDGWALAPLPPAENATSPSAEADQGEAGPGASLGGAGGGAVSGAGRAFNLTSEASVGAPEGQGGIDVAADSLPAEGAPGDEPSLASDGPEGRPAPPGDEYLPTSGGLGEDAGAGASADAEDGADASPGGPWGFSGDPSYADGGAEDVGGEVQAGSDGERLDIDGPDEESAPDPLASASSPEGDSNAMAANPFDAALAEEEDPELDCRAQLSCEACADVEPSEKHRCHWSDELQLCAPYLRDVEFNKALCGASASEVGAADATAEASSSSSSGSFFVGSIMMLALLAFALRRFVAKTLKRKSGGATYRSDEALDLMAHPAGGAGGSMAQKDIEQQQDAPADDTSYTSWDEAWHEQESPRDALGAEEPPEPQPAQPAQTAPAQTAAARKSVETSRGASEATAAAASVKEPRSARKEDAESDVFENLGMVVKPKFKKAPVTAPQGATLPLADEDLGSADAWWGREDELEQI